MRKGNFALRLLLSLFDEARDPAERAARADATNALDILSKAGAGKRPVKGGELAG